ncbi:MAG: hypothetical protein HXY50_16290 [Ignavibacteriaceae bacterium]|nr:hypothetical protein [Ignavibacteriaceae bacterium]
MKVSVFKLLIKTIPIAMVMLIFSCSPTKEIRYEDVPKKETYETSPKLTFKPMEVRERELISKLKISAIERINFVFDKRNNLINKGKLSTTKFDKKGFAIETILYDEKGNILNRFEYKYNSDGLRSQSLRYDKHNKLDKKFKYDYDIVGNKIKAFRYSINDKLEKYYEYEYDSKLNLILDEWYNVNGDLEFKIENDYDERGNKVVSYSYDADGQLQNKVLYKYDDKREIIIEEQNFDAADNQTGIVQYLYKYY